MLPILQAGTLVFQACKTLADSLLRDYQATSALFRLYGPQWELNPITRLVGPEIYFGTLLGLASRCDDSHPAWQLASVVLWIVQSFAVHTHSLVGTDVAGAPLIWFRW